jgi:carboxyl-terminal processing protease
MARNITRPSKIARKKHAGWTLVNSRLLWRRYIQNHERETMEIYLIPTLLLLVVLSSYSNDDVFDSKLAWNEMVSTLQSDYAYLDKVEHDFKNLTDLFHVKALATKSPKEFVDESQLFLRNFQDPHLNISPLDLDDYIVYPTGSDIYAEIKGEEIYIIDVKANSSAYEQGIRSGMFVKSIDGLAFQTTIEAVTGLTADNLSKEQQAYAINIALGGKRYQSRTLTVSTDNGLKTYNLDPSYDRINKYKNGPKVTHREINGIGYIRFNNALGDNDSVTEFRSAIKTLEQTKGLIIDLRNTPSGGKTGVAEPILGHFTKTERPYQLYKTQQSGQHYSDASFQKATAFPQTPFIDKPFVVLAGRWTGSMGEGMTIGLDALGAKAILGAPMADLLGGIKQIQLIESNATLSLGFERMYHIDGRFREDFKPTIFINSADTDEKGNDITLLKALEVLIDN